MPDIKQLISLQFDSTGCTSNFVYPMGDINFDNPSAVGDHSLRCAYFPLYNNSGLYFKNYEISDIISNTKPCAIYFKYKITDKDNLLDIAPIISYQKNEESDTTLFLSIEKHKYFVLHTQSAFGYVSSDISYTLDNEWHTFYCCFTEDKNIILMIDGRINKKFQLSVGFKFSENIFIGYHSRNNHCYSFNGYLDDINIYDKPLYRFNFAPPTNYIGTADVISNYYHGDKSYNYGKDVIDGIELVKEHTVNKLNKNQLGWLPRRADLTWHVETDGYFRNGEYEVLPRTVDYTTVTIMEINQPIHISKDPFIEGNLLTLMDSGSVYPLMVFANGYLVKLSKIYMIKSHDRYTLKLLGRDPKHSEEIKTFDIVILPFSIIYEEDYGERTDLTPLYSFSADGKFTTNDVNIFYYINEPKEPTLKQIGIREHTVSDKQFAYNKNKEIELPPENNFLRYIYKYGVLELERFDDDGLGAFIKFDSTYEHSLGEVRFVDPDDRLRGFRHTSTTYQQGDTVYAHAKGNRIPSYIRLRAINTGTTLDNDIIENFYKAKKENEEFIVPGDTIAVYNGSALLNPKFYTIVGHNLLYVPNIYDAGIKFGRNITIQKIANSKLSLDGLMTSNSISIRTVNVQATVQNQSIFKIPEVVDEDGIEYHKFLLFKGHVLMEDENRYTIDTATNSIQLLSLDDYMPKGRNLTFLFLKYNKASALGVYYPKPIFVYANPDENGIVTIEPPKGLAMHKNNCAVFVNDTFVSPYRLNFLSNNSFKILEDADLRITTNSNVIVVFIEIMNTVEDPVTDRDKMIANQIKRGSRFVLYDLCIPKKYKITIDNFLCFDEEGKYIPDLSGRIYNYNIVQSLKTSEPLLRQVRYMTCIYRTDSLENKANILHYVNEPFIREYLKGRQEFYEMDQYFDDLISDFNFTHSYDLTYGENLANSLDYIMNYDKNKIDGVYEKNANITRKEYNISRINQYLTKNSSGQYDLIIPRDEYQSNISRTYPVFFDNGKLATEWHKNALDDMNYTKITLPSRINATSRYESIDFHGMNNYLIPLSNTARIHKEINSDLFARILTGEALDKHFYARIAVKEYINTMFDATIDVLPQEQYTELKTNIEFDALYCTIIPSPPYEIGILTKLEVEDMPKGVEIDLNQSNRAYDFSATIEVPENNEVIIEN